MLFWNWNSWIAAENLNKFIDCEMKTSCTWQVSLNQFPLLLSLRAFSTFFSAAAEFLNKLFKPQMTLCVLVFVGFTHMHWWHAICVKQMHFNWFSTFISGLVVSPFGACQEILGEHCPPPRKSNDPVKNHGSYTMSWLFCCCSRGFLSFAVRGGLVKCYLAHLGSYRVVKRNVGVHAKYSIPPSLPYTKCVP